MKILVISDTHIPSTCNALPTIIKNEAKTSDSIIHAGDILNIETVHELESYAKLYAVCGNMDNNEVKKILPQKIVIQLEGNIIAITHGAGSPTNILNHLNTTFETELDKIDLFIFGHSHIAFDKTINSKIYFNPGSATDTVFAPYRSYGILELTNKTIKRRIEKIG